MEALQIIAQSWPIAAMFVAGAGGLMTYAIVRRVTATGDQQRLLDVKERLMAAESENFRLRKIEHDPRD